MNGDYYDDYTGAPDQYYDDYTGAYYPGSSIYDQQQEIQDAEAYGTPGNWWYQQVPADNKNIVGDKGGIWDQLLKALPQMLGTGLGAWAKNKGNATGAKGTSMSNTQQQWAPGTLEFIQSMLGSSAERMAAPAINPLQRAAWINSISPYLSGTDPFTQTADWAQNQMYNPVPSQFTEARQSLANQQEFARTQLPEQLEQLTGWDRGNRGRVTEQENDLVANFLNQLEQQKQGLLTQEAEAARQRSQFGATMYPQISQQGTTTALSLLGYPEDKQREQWLAQAQPFLQLLNILTGHPAGTIQTGERTGKETGGNSWLSALGALGEPLGRKLTDILIT